MDELGKLEIRGDMLNFLFEIKYIDFTYDPIYMLIRPVDMKEEVIWVGVGVRVGVRVGVGGLYKI